jgi:uncharacterized membrane protein YfcA
MYMCALANGLNVGIPGISTFATTTLVASREEGALARRFFGLLVPVLLAADGTASYLYRGTSRWDIVRDVVLPIAVGMFAGFLILGKVDSTGVRRGIGMVVIMMCCAFYAMARENDSAGIAKTEDDLPTKTPTNAMIGSKNSQRSWMACLKAATGTGLFRAVLAFICGTLSVLSNGSSLIMIVYVLCSIVLPSFLVHDGLFVSLIHLLLSANLL